MNNLGDIYRYKVVDKMFEGSMRRFFVPVEPVLAVDPGAAPPEMSGGALAGDGGPALMSWSLPVPKCVRHDNEGVADRNFEPIPKEESMTDLEILQARYEYQLEQSSNATTEFKAKLELAGRFPNDDFEPGTVIAFDRRFVGNQTLYSYAGVKADDGRWYVTGSKMFPGGYRWVDLIETLVDQGELVSFAVVTDMEGLI